MASADFLARYDAMADRAAAAIISSYSTSFSMATNLLSPAIRRDIHNLYAMVRIADEIVDGTAEQAGRKDTARILEAYEQQVRTAPQKRFHTDPIIHAYAQTARRCRFKDEHLAGFFRSMAKDTQQSLHTEESLDEYIYGSAEVIGLLCLSVFYSERRVSAEEYAELEEGARALGAAFQKVNFLRDFAEDTHSLGRCYFPGATSSLGNTTKDAIVAEIYEDLSKAEPMIAQLPLNCRAGVLAAASLFKELTKIIDDIDAEDILHHRVRVPARRKALIIARSLIQAPQLQRRKA